MAWKEICVTALILAGMMLVMPTSASSSSLSDLKTLVSSFDDSRMNVQDLAFYLASHDFDATPNGDCVEVDLGRHIYRLMPNGSAPGLANMAA
jgi:hypothetical protein